MASFFKVVLYLCGVLIFAGCATSEITSRKMACESSSQVKAACEPDDQKRPAVIRELR